MNYYYDVLLNYQELFYMFYDWDKDDDVIVAKKIPLFRVESNTLMDMMFKKIKVDNNFLNSIYNKCKLRNNKFLKYNAIFSDGKNSIALELDDNGVVINKSSLVLDDELSINDFIYGQNIYKLNYTIISKDNLIKESRIESKIKRLLNIEINNLYESKNDNKLIYLYLEWFNEFNNNIDEIYKNMLDKLNSGITNKELKIYELVKLSYNNV